jgi:chain length determinant protein tyrosine kinase EpsG
MTPDMKPLQKVNGEPVAEWIDSSQPLVRRIGSLMRETCDLTDDDVDRILTYQKKNGLRFGEAAVALKFAERQDVIEALSRQFQYTAGFAGRELSTEVAAAVDPFGDQAEAFRELRTRLLLEVPAGRERAALSIVSPDIGDGKTYLAANLAVTLSQLGERTLLIDADIRTPRLHRLFRVEPTAGLSNLLAGFADASGLVYPVPGMSNLHLLAAGTVPPNPLELLQRPAFGALLREMLERFDHVIVDTPAAIRGPDSRVVAARCGAALIVARPNRSAMGPLEGFVASLARGPARIAGVVLNEH